MRNVEIPGTSADNSVDSVPFLKNGRRDQSRGVVCFSAIVYTKPCAQAVLGSIVVCAIPWIFRKSYARRAISYR